MALAEADEEIQSELNRLEREKPDSIEVAECLEKYARALKQKNLRLLDAANMEARARVIRKKCEQWAPAHSEDEKDCPHCAERIKARATICRYCKMDLTEETPAPNLPADCRLCPHCHQTIKREAVLCKYCKSALGASTTTPETVPVKNSTGKILGIASICIGLYAGSFAPYFAAIFLIPFALILGLVGLGLGNRGTSIAGVAISLLMFPYLMQRQAEIETSLNKLQHELNRGY